MTEMIRTVVTIAVKLWGSNNKSHNLLKVKRGSMNFKQTNRLAPRDKGSLAMYLTKI